MKRFVFSLEQVRAWNATQLQLQEAELEDLLERQRQAEAAFASLCLEHGDFEQRTLHQSYLDALELAQIDQFRQYVVLERQRLEASRLEYARQIAERRARLVETRRKMELFDRLKRRQKAAWTAEESKELQAAADEVFLQRIAARRA